MNYVLVVVLVAACWRSPPPRPAGPPPAAPSDVAPPDAAVEADNEADNKDAPDGEPPRRTIRGTPIKPECLDNPLRQGCM